MSRGLPERRVVSSESGEWVSLNMPPYVACASKYLQTGDCR
jgi:hypothetical protein